MTRAKKWYKPLLFILVALLLLELFTGVFSYWGWKEVEVENYGTIKVPGDWVYTRLTDGGCFSDRPLEEDGCVYYLVETGAILDRLDESLGIVREMEPMYGNVLSNGAVYGSQKMKINNQKTEVCFLMTYTTDFLAYDDSVDSAMVEKIAKTYRYQPPA